MISVTYAGLQTDLQEQPPSCEAGTEHWLQQHVWERVAVTGSLCAQYFPVV